MAEDLLTFKYIRQIKLMYYKQKKNDYFLFVYFPIQLKQNMMSLIGHVWDQYYYGVQNMSEV